MPAAVARGMGHPIPDLSETVGASAGKVAGLKGLNGRPHETESNPTQHLA
jgi:hypothetical protein